jgi:hypothetical protein
MSSKPGKQTSMEVFKGTSWTATMIKEMLVENGIQAFIQNEYGATASPYTFGILDSIKVIVSSENYDTALEYIKEFNENYSAGNND